MRYRGMAVVGALLLAAFAPTGTTNPANGAERRRGDITVLEFDPGLAAFAGTVHGTVVLLHEVREGDAVVAVRRREIGLDGTTVADVTTPLPPDFAWSSDSTLRKRWPDASVATADIDTDGTAVLSSSTQVRRLAADGTLSDALVPTNPASTVRLRGGFVHLLEPVVGSPRRTTYVWEGFRPDGTRVGPSLPLDPSPELKAMADDPQDSFRVDAKTWSFDGRADGSADVVLRTALPPPSPTNTNAIWVEYWLYRIDTSGAAHSVPGPQPRNIGWHTSETSMSPRVHSAPGGVSWSVTDIAGIGQSTSVAANGSPIEVGSRAIELDTTSASGVDGTGRLIVLGLTDSRGAILHDRARVWWSSFSAIPGEAPRLRSRKLRDAGRRRTVVRSVESGSRCAAIAPDGSSLFASPAASRGVGFALDSVIATIIDPRGRAVRRAAIDAPGIGDVVRRFRAVACGDHGFAFAWLATADRPDHDSDPVGLALVPRR